MSAYVIDASRAARKDESSPANVISFPSGAAIAAAAADAALASLLASMDRVEARHQQAPLPRAELYVLLVHAERIRRQLGNPPRADAAYWQRMLPDLMQLAADPGRGLGVGPVMMHFDAEQQFREAASRRGLELPNLLVYGQLSRCSVAGDKGKKQSGSYLYYADGVPAGGFQNFKDGLGWQDWHAGLSRQLSAAEIEENRRRRKETDAQRAADEAARYAEAAKKAAWIWNKAKPAPASHPYLAAKGVAAHGLRLWKGSLVVPVQDVDGELHSLQFIMADGAKRFLTGGRTRGCFYLLGTIDPAASTIIIGEGFATCASVHEADAKWTLAVAFDAGNLEAVARALKDRYPKAGFIIAADDDWKTADANGKPANPGRDYGLKAAKAIGARFAFPKFDPGRHRLDEWTDFNDLHMAEGIGRVRECIDGAEYVGDATAEQAEPKSELEATLERLALLSSTPALRPTHWE